MKALRRIALVASALVAAGTFGAPAWAETLTATSDTYINENAGGTNYASANPLLVDGTPIKRALVTFDASGTVGTVTSATLTLTVAANSAQSMDIVATNCDWLPATGVTWNNRPGFNDVLASKATLTLGVNNFTIDPAYINDDANKVVCFYVSKVGPTAVSVNSVEAAGGKLTLVLARGTVPNTGITTATVNSGGTAIAADGSTSTSATDASFSSFYVGAGETVDHYECRIDGATYATCTSPKNYTSLATGPHTFDLRACGTAGSTLCDTTPATRTWTVNAPIPNTGISTWTPGGDTSSTSASFGGFYVGVDDVVDHYECRLDGGSYATCTDPKSYTSLSTGAHTFDLRACNGGGCDASPATRTWTVSGSTPAAYNGLSPNKYLSPSGSNSNGPTCSSGSPCQTLAYAGSIANAGDVWGLADGSYVGPGAITRGGSSGSRIVYVAQRQYGAVVGSSGNSYPAFDVRATYVDVEWLAVTADPDGGIALNGSYDRAIGNHVYAMAAPACGTGTGIWAGNGNDIPSAYASHDQTITQNIVNDLGPVGGWADGDCPTGPHGIYVAVPNVTVTNNLVYHVVGGGITSWHAATAMQAINNTVVDAGQEGIEVGMGDSGDDGLGHRNALIQNNIVVSSGLSGVAESGGSPATGNHYYNNTLYNNPFDYCAISCLINSTDELSTTVGDPSFVTWSDDGNSGNDDFHVQSGSSAVGSGRSTSAPGVDLNGATRPTGGAVDRGAYER